MKDLIKEVIGKIIVFAILYFIWVIFCNSISIHEWSDFGRISYGILCLIVLFTGND